MKLSIASLTIFAALISVGLSCSCAQTTFEDNYCRSDTSVRVKVLAQIDNCRGTCDPFQDQVNGKIIYILRVITLFKGAQIEDDVMFAITAVNGGLCGTILTVGEEYLLNLGNPNVNNNACPPVSYDVGLCNFPVLWSSVTRAQRRFVITNSETNDSLCT